MSPGRHNGDDAAQEPQWVRKGIDLAVTLLLWSYFTLGFAALFGPFYLAAVILTPWRRLICQHLNHCFFRGFFALCRVLIPRCAWRIDPAVKRIRSAVVVCNHISYIDSILMVSLFKRHSTIAKERLFHIPVLGWVLRLSGYLPSTSEGALAELMLARVQTLAADLAHGANFFVFPEGTRSRTGAIGDFNPGAFKIARLCRAPLRVLLIRNTDRLFTPGRFLFNTGCANTISVELLAEVAPPYEDARFSIAGLMAQVRALMQAKMAAGAG